MSRLFSNIVIVIDDKYLRIIDVGSPGSKKDYKNNIFTFFKFTKFFKNILFEKANHMLL